MANTRGRVFVVKQSFSYFDEEDGMPRTLVVGQRIRENHPLMDGREQFFKLEDSPILELPEPKPAPVSITKE